MTITKKTGKTIQIEDSDGDKVIVHTVSHITDEVVTTLWVEKDTTAVNFTLPDLKALKGWLGRRIKEIEAKG